MRVFSQIKDVDIFRPKSDSYRKCNHKVMRVKETDVFKFYNIFTRFIHLAGCGHIIVAFSLRHSLLLLIYKNSILHRSDRFGKEGYLVYSMYILASVTISGNN